MKQKQSRRTNDIAKTKKLTPSRTMRFINKKKTLLFVVDFNECLFLFLHFFFCSSSLLSLTWAFVFCFYHLLQHWTDQLMRLAYNLTQLNGSTTLFLQKAHTKLCLQVDKTGKIPVKKYVLNFTCL